jgi:hypothetical protein
MEICSLVPHKTIISYNAHKKIVISQGNSVARAVFENEYLKTVNNIPIHMRKVKKLQGLPRLKKDVIYIVSSIFQQSIDEDMADSYHIYSPDTLSESWISDGGSTWEVSRLAKFER